MGREGVKAEEACRVRAHVGARENKKWSRAVRSAFSERYEWYQGKSASLGCSTAASQILQLHLRNKTAPIAAFDHKRASLTRFPPVLACIREKLPSMAGWMQNKDQRQQWCRVPSGDTFQAGYSSRLASPNYCRYIYKEQNTSGAKLRRVLLSRRETPRRQQKAANSKPKRRRLGGASEYDRMQNKRERTRAGSLRSSRRVQGYPPCVCTTGDA